MKSSFFHPKQFTFLALPTPTVIRANTQSHMLARIIQFLVVLAASTIGLTIFHANATADVLVLATTHADVVMDIALHNKEVCMASPVLHVAKQH